LWVNLPDLAQTDWNMKNITALFIVKNEEQNLTSALESVKWADEIVVVDGGSRDKTVDIAARFGAKVIVRSFDDFYRQRSFALEQVSTPWVLGLDADERVSNELADLIRRIISKDTTEFDGYQILRKNYFYGRSLRHIWKDDFQLRLFKKASASVANTPVHEGYVVKGSVGTIAGAFIEHRPYPDISKYVEKMNLYTRLEAPALLLKRKRIRKFDLILHPFSELWRNLIAHRGFRDGYPGFVMCLLTTVNNFVLYAKAYELQQKNRIL
jgi:glycosyltransferase involved in cell wall biosynthesis